MSVRACAAFAWLNLVRADRARFVVALAGSVVAIFILLLDLAFLRGVEHKATQVYALFDAEVIMVSDRFQFLIRMGDFPAARLRQALSVPDVAAAAAVRIGSTRWVSPGTNAEATLLLIGIDPAPEFIAEPEIRALVPELSVSRNVLLDRRIDPDVGAVEIGDRGLIGRQPATVAGRYDLGLPMYAALTGIVANTDFSLYTRRDPQRIQLGVLRVAPGADVNQVVARLRAAVPPDVRVMTRAELMAREAEYFIEVKPLGIMMRAGLLIGLIVGAVALYQVMSSQVESRLQDFAVLRAIGFSRAFTYGVGVWQLALMALTAFALAWLGALPVFDAIARKSHLSLPADATLLATAAALCAPMIASAALPLLRAGRAEPARLFLHAS